MICSLEIMSTLPCSVSSEGEVYSPESVAETQSLHHPQAPFLAAPVFFTSAWRLVEVQKVSYMGCTLIAC